MSKLNFCTSKILSYAAAFLTAVLFVGANSASSCMVYQPKAPASLSRFCKIK